MASRRTSPVPKQPITAQQPLIGRHQSQDTAANYAEEICMLAAAEYGRRRRGNIFTVTYDLDGTSRSAVVHHIDAFLTGKADDDAVVGLHFAGSQSSNEDEFTFVVD